MLVLPPLLWMILFSLENAADLYSFGLHKDAHSEYVIYTVPLSYNLRFVFFLDNKLLGDWSDVTTVTMSKPSFLTLTGTRRAGVFSEDCIPGRGYGLFAPAGVLSADCVPSRGCGVFTQTGVLDVDCILGRGCGVFLWVEILCGDYRRKWRIRISDSGVNTIHGGWWDNSYLPLEVCL